MDSAAFGTYALLWFITFVYMAAEWGEVTSHERDLVKSSGGKVSTIQAAIAFSFFAILIWVSVYVCVCLCLSMCVYVCVCPCVCTYILRIPVFVY